jgi:acylphosphatase
MSGRRKKVMVQQFLVKGRVQGVGFRWFVQNEAARIGLRGWVRNTDDGHVEVMAAGTPDQLEDLVQALARGTRGSRVDNIESHPVDESEGDELQSFQIEGAW